MQCIQIYTCKACGNDSQNHTKSEKLLFNVKYFISALIRRKRYIKIDHKRVNNINTSIRKNSQTQTQSPSNVSREAVDQ